LTEHLLTIPVSHIKNNFLLHAVMGHVIQNHQHFQVITVQ